MTRKDIHDIQKKVDKQVYAIHVGCKYEGGGVVGIYLGKESAIDAALKILEEHKKQTLLIHGDDAHNWRWKEINLSEKYDSKLVIKLWQNPVEEIIVYEYPLNR